jgi:glycosyltransferase involved in cell wall biosynthesis
MSFLFKILNSLNCFELVVFVFRNYAQKKIEQSTKVAAKLVMVEVLSAELRILVRQAAGLSGNVPTLPSVTDLVQEISFLRLHQELLAPVFKILAHKRVLFAGQAYYNAWYLSRSLRDHGWKADVLNWDMDPTSQIYYHGEDFAFDANSPTLIEELLDFYVLSIYGYDVFHFSNVHGITFGFPIQHLFEQNYLKHSEITLLKVLEKKIVYSNNGCLDGVSQTAFAKWGPESVCNICRWRNEPSVCSDERNLAWGNFRNSVADFQCTLGGNRLDYNDDPRVHEIPEFYCLDTEIWHPEIAIPDQFRLPSKPVGTLWLYHAVGHKADRTTEDGVNIKSSHVYLPLVSKLKEQGMLLELLEPTGIPNREVRFLQAQADIFLEMLTYGWFGANAREAMFLGKPVICYIRPEWLESVREELPDYARELPIVSATPQNVEEILRDLILNPEKRREIGVRSRLFAVKWHSAEAGGRRFDEIYSGLLRGEPMLRESG